MTFTVATYLDTFRRVPDAVIRAIDPDSVRERWASPAYCYCGALASHGMGYYLTRSVQLDLDEFWDRFQKIPVGQSDYRCLALYGGLIQEWNAIYTGVMNPDKRRAIDDAFLERRVQAFMTETFTLTLVPEKYCVWRDGIPSKLTIARRSDTTWAVVSRSGYVVNTDGELETEPSPSNRAKDFLDRTRVETIDDALARAKLYFQLYGADA
jgi:hypothetical protein